MKKTAILLLVLSMTILCACDGTENYSGDFEKLRESIQSCGEVMVKAEVTADYGGKIEKYTLMYTESADGGIVEVLEPEIIAGIKAHCGDTISIEYDGVMLDTGGLPENAPSPISALPAIIESIRTGHVESYGRESGGGLRVDVLISDGTAQSLWLDAETKLPLRSEIRSGERVVITCTVLEWTVA